MLAFSPALPGFLCRAARFSAPAKDQTVLVILQLSGGNDGLNTVIPFEDDAYHRSRPTLHIPANRALKLGTRLGLHPEMAALLPLYGERQLAIVQGVGYVNSSRSHEKAMQDWHTANPLDNTLQTGWAGRALDQFMEKGVTDVPGVFVGHIRPPFSSQAERAMVPAVRSLDQWAVVASASASRKEVFLDSLAKVYEGDAAGDPLARDIQRCGAAAFALSRRLDSRNSAEASSYPQSRLAQTLRTMAQMIRAGLEARFYFAELGGGGIGGFDTHAGQAANHGALLRELAEALAAFANDLRKDKLLDRVLLMTFSEFGRTLAENGRRGTGHGAAQPLFLVGGGVKGGLVGEHPSLTDLEVDSPKARLDFRRVYATLLEQWLGLNSQAILGRSFPPAEGMLTPA